MHIKVLNISNNNNMGDIILGETAVFLAKDALKRMGVSDIQVERIEVIPDKSDLVAHHPFGLVLGRAIQELSYIFKPKKGKRDRNIQYRIFNVGAKVKSTGYYKEQFKNVDAVIIAEGAMKYSLQDFSYYFEIINKTALKLNIPVMLNAMSIEKGNQDDFRYHQLKKAVNMDSVRLITTRDGEEGVRVLQEDYDVPSSKCKYVGDTAFWIPNCYSIKKDSKSTIYGVGIMAPDVFIQNGFDLTEDKVKAFYLDVITILLEEKVDFRLFMNGLGGDYEFAVSIVEEMHLSPDLLLDKPKTPRDFIKMISGFKAIIGARMHACITAFSLGIPVVGLYWHDKLKKFADTMHMIENFYDSEHLDAEVIIRRMLEVSYNEDQINQREIYKRRTRDGIYEFLSEI